MCTDGFALKAMLSGSTAASRICRDHCTLIYITAVRTVYLLE